MRALGPFAAAFTLMFGMGSPGDAQEAYDAKSFEPVANARFSERIIAITDEVPAPDSVIDLAGGAHTTLDAHGGKVLLVTLWATWCHVCELEMPALAALAERYADRPLAVMPVSVDEPPAAEKVGRYLQRPELAGMPLMVDRNFGMAARVGLRGTPTTIIVDKFGQVVAAFEGQMPLGDSATHDYLEALMVAGDAEVSRNLLADLD